MLVRSVFTSEEPRKVGSWRFDTKGKIFAVATHCVMTSLTPPAARSMAALTVHFRDFQTSIFNSQDGKLSAKLLCVFIYF